MFINITFNRLWTSLGPVLVKTGCNRFGPLCGPTWTGLERSRSGCLKSGKSKDQLWSGFLKIGVKDRTGLDFKTLGFKRADGRVDMDNCKERKKEQKERKRETYCIVGLHADALQWVWTLFEVFKQPNNDKHGFEQCLNSTPLHSRLFEHMERVYNMSKHCQDQFFPVRTWWRREVW